jgi:uncharacterized Tic20 family protein
MPDEQTQETEVEQEDVERVSRLSSTEEIAARAEDVEHEYEQRYFGQRDDKPKRREMPRSYSTLTVSDNERMWAAAAHACVWLTLLMSILTAGTLIPLSIFAPLVIYFAFRNRSDYVAFHALQAFVLQLLGTVGALTLLVVGTVVWLIGLVVAVLTILIAVGVILVPLWGVVGILLLLAVVALPIAMLLFGAIAAIETYNGRDYRYPFIAQWVDRQLAGGLLTII